MFHKLLVGLHRFEDGALIFALFSMLFFALLQIVLRNVFESGFLWADSFVRILVLWVAMLGAMVATRERNHISIDVLSRVIPANTIRPLKAVCTFFSAVICLTAAWYCAEYIQYEYEDGTIAFASVPVWVCQSILPVGFSVMGLRFLFSLFQAEQ